MSSGCPVPSNATTLDSRDFSANAGVFCCSTFAKPTGASGGLNRELRRYQARPARTAITTTEGTTNRRTDGRNEVLDPIPTAANRFTSDVVVVLSAVFG